MKYVLLNFFMSIINFHKALGLRVDINVRKLNEEVEKVIQLLQSLQSPDKIADEIFGAMIIDWMRHSA